MMNSTVRKSSEGRSTNSDKTARQITRLQQDIAQAERILENQRANGVKAEYIAETERLIVKLQTKLSKLA